jgi:hypothetical protein
VEVQERGEEKDGWRRLRERGDEKAYIFLTESRSRFHCVTCPMRTC